VKFPAWLSFVCWGIVTIVLTTLLCYRYQSFLGGNPSGFEITVFCAWVATLLIAVVTEIELPGIKMSRKLAEKGIRNIPKDTVIPAAQLPAHPAEGRSPMENKILKTFWTKTVNRITGWFKGRKWGFRIQYNSLDYFEWRDAASKLRREHLILENPEGMIFLTDAGFKYCKEHHNKLGEDEFWPEEKIKQERLKGVLAMEVFRVNEPVSLED